MPKGWDTMKGKSALCKNIFPTRYYCLLFCIQNLTDVDKSSKCVMTKEKLDKQLAGQSSIPYMSIKTHPSTKNNIVKFDEYKLMNNQIDRLAEVMERTKTKP